MLQKTKNNSKESIRKFVVDFKGLISIRDIAKEIAISESLLSYIIQGKRTDHYNALEHCKKEIEKKLKAIMPN